MLPMGEPVLGTAQWGGRARPGVVGEGMGVIQVWNLLMTLV